MQKMNKECALCSMEGTHAVTKDGQTKYYCSHHVPAMTQATVLPSAHLRELAPLLGIFGVVTGLTLFTGYMFNDMSSMGLMMYLMAFFFLVFGVLFTSILIPLL
jgi:hypothetical protein